MCNVPLSELAARRELSGEKPSEKMMAGSTPRLNSAIFAAVTVLKTRMMVPFSLAVASSCSSLLMHRARSDPVCAGMMRLSLLRPCLSRSTIQTWPTDWPRKAIRCFPRQQRPYGFGLVLCSESMVGLIVALSGVSCRRMWCWREINVCCLSRYTRVMGSMNCRHCIARIVRWHQRTY
jgi:hypothetical protein